MADLNWTVDGRRFRSDEEYQAALRDKAKIDSMTEGLSRDNENDVEKLYMELKKGNCSFETIVGRQFDDNIYELYKQNEAKKEQKAQEKRQREEKVKGVLWAAAHPKRTAADKKKAKSSGEKVKFSDYDKNMQREIIRAMKERQRKRRIVIAVCALVCVASLGYFTAYYRAAAKNAQQIEELVAMKEAGAKNTGEVTIHYTSTEIEVPDVLNEYAEILSMNENLIGWVKIDGTVIDYPVMQTDDNEYYLKHNFNEEEDNNGCIFMDYQCDVVKGCDNIILYGHKMQSGKMFGTLNKYSKKSYYEEHPIIEFDTIYEKGEYQIMYVFRSKVYSEEEVTFKYYQFINADSAKEFNSYMNEMAALSLYDTGVTASYGDQLLTLSTCDYYATGGRFVVVAKKIN